MESITKIKELLKGVKINPYGVSYLKELDTAFLMYGEKGLRGQVNYILCNCRFSKDQKQVKKTLLDYANKGGML